MNFPLNSVTEAQTLTFALSKLLKWQQQIDETAKEVEVTIALLDRLRLLMVSTFAASDVAYLFRSTL